MIINAATRRRRRRRIWSSQQGEGPRPGRCKSRWSTDSSCRRRCRALRRWWCGEKPMVLRGSSALAPSPSRHGRIHQTRLLIKCLPPSSMKARRMIRLSACADATSLLRGATAAATAADCSDDLCGAVDAAHRGLCATRRIAHRVLLLLRLLRAAGSLHTLLAPAKKYILRENIAMKDDAHQEPASPKQAQRYGSTQ